MNDVLLEEDCDLARVVLIASFARSLKFAYSA